MAWGGSVLLSGWVGSLSFLFLKFFLLRLKYWDLSLKNPFGSTVTGEDSHRPEKKKKWKRNLSINVLLREREMESKKKTMCTAEVCLQGRKKYSCVFFVFLWSNADCFQSSTILWFQRKKVTSHSLVSLCALYPGSLHFICFTHFSFSLFFLSLSFLHDDSALLLSCQSKCKTGEWERWRRDGGVRLIRWPE